MAEMTRAALMAPRERRTRILALAVGAAGVLLAAPLLTAPAQAEAGPVTIAEGLNNPRQLAFTPRGDLYVAETGVGGTGVCQPSPEGGDMCFGLSGSIAKIGAEGSLQRVVTGLPSTGEAGPFDLEFKGNFAFGLTIGLGGDADVRAQFGEDATMLGTVVTGDLRDPTNLKVAFDVVAYEAAHDPDGGGIDSNPTGLIRWGNSWLVTDSGGNDVVSNRHGGTTHAVLPPIDSSMGFPAQAVPTDIVRGPDGAWYVSELTGFPFDKGASSVYRLSNKGTLTPWATGLTNVTSLAFGNDGHLYGIELTTEGLLTQSAGALVKITPQGTQVVADGLMQPYGVAIRGGFAYVTTGTVAGAGGGSVVKIQL